MKFDAKLEVIFRMVGAEDGSLESWIGTVNFISEAYEIEDRKFYYSSRTRKGTISEYGTMYR